MASLELDFGVKRGALVPMDRAATVVTGEFAAVRTWLLGLPTKVAPTLAILTETSAVCSTLRAGIGEALDALSTEDALDARLRR